MDDLDNRVKDINSDDEEEEEVNRDVIISNVRKFIIEECECPDEHVPEDIIIPVCGLWAYRARMLSTYLDSSNRRKQVVKILSQCSNQPSGQGEDPVNRFLTNHVDQLVQELEEYSNIRTLEQR